MTIQEVIQNCNKKEVANTYIYKYGFMSSITYEDRYDSMTIGEYKNSLRERVYDLIDRISKAEPKKTDDDMVFLVTHSVDEYDEDITVHLFDKKDLAKDKEYYTSYGYEFTPIEETLLYEVADTYLTRYYLVDLIAEYLFEVTFFGWEQENLNKALDKLKGAKEDAEKHKDDPHYYKNTEDFIKEMEEATGFELEKRDPAQEEAYYKLIKQQGDYCNKCIQIEIEKYRKTQKKS